MKLLAKSYNTPHYSMYKSNNLGKSHILIKTSEIYLNASHLYVWLSVRQLVRFSFRTVNSKAHLLFPQNVASFSAPCHGGGGGVFFILMGCCLHF